MEWLNIGGGFGIPYFMNDRALDIAPIADNLARRLGGGILGQGGQRHQDDQRADHGQANQT